ncbi:hypothetical protein U1Q18_022778 [Sarracenia purpurea var. burkii]
MGKFYRFGEWLVRWPEWPFRKMGSTILRDPSRWRRLGLDWVKDLDRGDLVSSSKKGEGT